MLFVLQRNGGSFGQNQFIRLFFSLNFMQYTQSICLYDENTIFDFLMLRRLNLPKI